MADKRQNITRRTALKHLGAIGVTAAATTSSASALPTQPQSEVPQGLAKQAANKKKLEVSAKKKFADWAGASLGQPETFYSRVRTTPSPEYEKSAYVFPITDDGTNLGYITISAQADCPPILEYSRATPPQDKVGKTNDTVKKLSTKATGRFLYSGGLSYDYELQNGNAVSLGGQFVKSLPETASLSRLNFDSATSKKKWQAQTSDDEVSIMDNTGGGDGGSGLPDSYTIDGVPGYATDYISGSDGKDTSNDTFSEYNGSPGDYWHKYDGCAPYAGANIVGFHEDISLYSWDRRNELIDRMHRNMETGNNIYTAMDKIAPGIEKYSNGTYSYSATYNTSFSASALKQEVYEYNPAMLSLWGGETEDGSRTYDEHSVCVFGYDHTSSDLLWKIYDSWGYQEHMLQNGNWNAAETVFVSRY